MPGEAEGELVGAGVSVGVVLGEAEGELVGAGGSAASCLTWSLY